MPKYNESSAVMDGIIKAAMLGGITIAALLAPNAIQLFDKPTQRYIKTLDNRSRQREFKRLLTYMHRQGLVTGHYDHGLEITDKARKRLEKTDINNLCIEPPKHWDKQWRIIFYDVPELQKAARDQLAAKLRSLGCQQLQRSVWIHPFPCQKELKAVAAAFGVETYITYLETTTINNEKALIKHFSHLL